MHMHIINVRLDPLDKARAYLGSFVSFFQFNAALEVGLRGACSIDPDVQMQLCFERLVIAEVIDDALFPYRRG